MSRKATSAANDKTAEKTIQQQIQLALGSRFDVRVFRNNVGVGFQGTVVKEDPPVMVIRNTTRIRFGLFPGSSDLIGWREITVTPDMVGKKIAVFTAVEVKTATGFEQENQENWRRVVSASGGIAIVGRSDTQAVEEVLSWRP